MEVATNILDTGLMEPRWLVPVKISHRDCIEKITRDRCEKAFSTLFLFYSSKLYSYVKGDGFEDSAARDIVQEVMTTVWLKSHLFDPNKGSVSAWIYTIARNAKYDLYRKNKKEQYTISSEDIWPSTFEENHFVNPQSLEKTHQKDQLIFHIKKLPLNQQEAISSVYLDGYTQSEYAAKENIPLGTVKSRIRIGLKKLNQTMGKQ